MHPLTFEEFLGATGETQAVERLHRTPLPDFAHKKLLKLFHRYTLIGGMLEIVQRYAESKNLAQLKNTYESLITAYLDDVEKYADKDSKAEVSFDTSYKAPFTKQAVASKGRLRTVQLWF